MREKTGWANSVRRRQHRGFGTASTLKEHARGGPGASSHQYLCPGFLCQAKPSVRFLTLVLERKLKISEMELNDVAQLVGRHF